MRDFVVFSFDDKRPVIEYRMTGSSGGNHSLIDGGPYLYGVGLK